jgi:phage terminase small subunit
MTKRKADEDRLIAKPGHGVFKRKRGANKNGAPLEARARGIDTGTIAGAMQISPDKPLSEMQKSFVKLWASGETILSASIKAGYSDGGTYAYRMVRMPNILKLYQEEKLAYESAANMSRKKVMEMLMESYEFAKILEEPTCMVAAAREIGKMCGYYEPVKVQHTVTHEGKIVHQRVESMDDAQLLEFISQQMETITAAAPPAALPAPEDKDVTDVTPK